MKKNIFKLVFLLQIVFLTSVQANECTAFMAVKKNTVLTGRNADSRNLNARMLVLPGSQGKYGRIFLGAGEGQNIGGFINTTGMNDRGLWYGSTSLYDGSAFPVRNDIKNYYNKPTLNYDLIHYVMEVCSTVDEVIEYFTTYYYPVWNGHHLFVDRNGNSVIIEFGERDVVFIRKKSGHQVMTNFPNADTLSSRWYNCYRYNTADRMLASSQEISTDLFRSICDAVHQEGEFPTSLSTVYDVTSGNLYVYYFHNYEEVLVFNLYMELARGENYYKIPDYYNQMKLRYPIKGETVNSSSVTFSWYGNAENYNLYYSTDPNFTNTEPRRISADHHSVESSSFIPTFFLSAFILGSIYNKRRKIIVLIIGLCFLCINMSCQIDVVDSPFTTSTIEHHQMVDNLQSGTLYYWKVEAIGSEGINSETTVQTFRINS